MGKKIIYIHPFVFPSIKANTVQVIKMCSAFKEIGIETTLVALKKLKYDKIDIIKYYGVKQKINTIFFLPINFFNKNLSKYLIVFFLILKYYFIKKNYIFFSRDIKLANFFLIFGFEVLLEMHTPPNNPNNLKILKKIIRKEKFLKLICISNNLKKYFQRYIKSKKIIIAPDGIEVNDLSKKKKLFKSKEVVISYVGSFHKGKGVDFIIKIARDLKNLNFNIYGGLNEQIKLLKKRATKNVLFHGHIQNSKIKKILSKTDIALMPYQKKVSSVGHNDISKWMSPLKMFEYMSNKTIIISSNHTVLREILNNKNSFLVKGYNEVDWIKKILFVMKNKILAKKKAEFAHKDAFKYTWTKRAKLIINEK